MVANSDKRAYGMDEACNYIGGVSRGHMYRLMVDENIPSFRISNRRYFLKEELDKFLERMSE